MKKWISVWLLLFMLFFAAIPVRAQSYVVSVPVSYTCKKDVSGKIIFTSDETHTQRAYTFTNNTKKEIPLSYSSLGTYRYTITKEKGSDANITYDERTYKVIVSLTRSETDTIRTTVIVYLQGSIEKLSEISYVDVVNSSSDSDTKNNTVPNNSGVQTNDNKNNQSSDSDNSSTTKDKSSSKSSKKKNNTNSRNKSSKSKNSTSKNSKSKSSSSGGDGTNTSNSGKNGDSSSSASSSDSANGKNGTMNNGQNGTSDASSGSSNENENGSNSGNGVLHAIETGDATTFIQWIILMIASFIGMVVIKRRKG